VQRAGGAERRWRIHLKLLPQGLSLKHGCFQARPHEAGKRNAVAGLMSRTSLFIIKIKRRIRGVFAVLFVF
jgi:hypothetical protein